MMYDGDTFEHNGRTFIFSTQWDDSHGAPWDEEDGHGIISEWTSRDKSPSERILAQDRGKYRYYDIQDTQRIAVRDSWGVQNPPEGATKRQIAALAVEEDFQRMRRYCNDQWNYIGVIVKDEMTGREASLWGLESDRHDCYEEITRELADELFPLADPIEAVGLELASD